MSNHDMIARAMVGHADRFELVSDVQSWESSPELTARETNAPAGALGPIAEFFDSIERGRYLFALRTPLQVFQAGVSANTERTQIGHQLTKLGYF